MEQKTEFKRTKKTKKILKLINVVIFDMINENYDCQPRMEGILKLIKLNPYSKTLSEFKKIIESTKDFSLPKIFTNFVDQWKKISLLEPAPITYLDQKNADYLYYHCSLRGSIKNYKFSLPMQILNAIAYDIRYDWNYDVEFRIQEMIRYTENNLPDSSRRDIILKGLNDALKECLEHIDGRSVRNYWERASQMSIGPINSADIPDYIAKNLLHPEIVIEGYQKKIEN